MKPIKAEETDIGVGAKIILRCASKQMINLLRRKYNEDKTCIIGDIDFLFSFDGIGLDKNIKLFRP